MQHCRLLRLQAKPSALIQVTQIQHQLLICIGATIKWPAHLALAGGEEPLAAFVEEAIAVEKSPIIIAITLAHHPCPRTIVLLLACSLAGYQHKETGPRRKPINSCQFSDNKKGRCLRAGLFITATNKTCFKRRFRLWPPYQPAASVPQNDRRTELLTRWHA